MLLRGDTHPGGESRSMANPAEADFDPNLHSSRLQKGNKLEFKINLRWYEDLSKKFADLRKTNIDQYLFFQVTGAETIVHETQHVRIITMALLDNRGTIPTGDFQHTLMRNKEKTYYKERLGFINQYSRYITNWLGKNNLNQIIDNIINEFDQ